MNGKGKRVGWIVMDCGMRADEGVGVVRKGWVEMSGGVVGVLKGGGGFVGIDGEYGDQGIEYILEERGGKVLLKEEGI
ncbi:hypothetical protein [Bacillus subtilis]|uniref:hypothetical protein n=1 Tax=Bacillus subtilis TaxID=1423 RepID=UPI00119F8451|nr:hypothetical protein [Bacillus subtilis]